MKLTIASYTGSEHSIDVPVMEMGVLALYEHAQKVAGLPYTLLNEYRAEVASFTHLIPGACYSITLESYNALTAASPAQEVITSLQNFYVFHEAYTRSLEVLQEREASHLVIFQTRIHYNGSAILTSRVATHHEINPSRSWAYPPTA